MTIEIQIDNNTKHEFRFNCFDNKVYLAEFSVMARQTIRHKYRCSQSCSRYYTKGNLKLSDIHVTDEMKKKAVAHYQSLLKFE